MEEPRYGRRWWLEQLVLFVVVSLVVVALLVAFVALDSAAEKYHWEYRWKPIDVGALLVGLLGLAILFFTNLFTSLGTSLEAIPTVGWIILLTGGVLWIKIQETREALEKHIRELRESVAQLEETLTRNNRAGY